MQLRTTLLSTCISAALLAVATPAICQTDMSFKPYPGLENGKPATVSVEVSGQSGSRVFAFSTSAIQRENAPTTRKVEERTAEMHVKSSNAMFDGLFTLALDDARLDSVATIRDTAYNDNQPIPCVCFETGLHWTYVWTRDLSYAADLSLAFVDPTRAVNSLTFKTSPFRSGVTPPAGLPKDSWQIIQDTGSGGSWPVSTDRVTWAFGAGRVLSTLDGKARADFVQHAYKVLRGTVEADRIAIYDSYDGLYTGEQSFLDWRDQTYAPYVLQDLTELAQSKALSTNVAHFQALKLTGELAAELGHSEEAARYAKWADALKTSINKGFWLPEKGLYASITTPDARAVPVEKYDMLGEALAVIYGVADADQSRQVVANYPHAPFGVPVYYPQQPEIPVYHNRAIWPFVTAYSLAAAAKVRNTAVADNAIDSLMRASALHLTNTENLEWLTGQTHFDNGPVVNSPRQLWSVGGYIGMVAGTVFGFHPESDSLRIDPFLTTHTRKLLGGQEATLSDIPYKGRKLKIVLKLPAEAHEGYYPLASVRLNGSVVGQDIKLSQLTAENTIEVTFGSPVAGNSAITMVPTVSASSRVTPEVFSPKTPVISLKVSDTGATIVQIAPQNDPAPVTYTVWRDGQVRADALTALEWIESEHTAAGIRRCYRVVAHYVSSRNASHPSDAACLDAGATQEIVLTNGSTKTVGSSTSGGNDLSIDGFKVAEAGAFALSLAYDNHLFDINTGITNAVKRVQLVDGKGRVVASGIVQMPHIQPEGDRQPVRYSTDLRTRLKPGSYSVRILDYFNMSYLQANASYVNAGGKSGPKNMADIKAVKLTRIQ